MTGAEQSTIEVHTRGRGFVSKTLVPKGRAVCVEAFMTVAGVLFLRHLCCKGRAVCVEAFMTMAGVVKNRSVSLLACHVGVQGGVSPSLMKRLEICQQIAADGFEYTSYQPGQ